MAEITPLPLKSLTTLRVGAAPARMIDAESRDELIATLRDVWASGDEWFVLGGGSNLFVGDDAFDGTVVRVRNTGIEQLPAAPGRVRLRVQAGHNWDDLVAYTVAQGFSGIEAMSGIPGTVGAAPVQNVGAYGQEIVGSLVEVELIDERSGDVAMVPAAELGLGFRTSVLKEHYGSVPERSAVIVSVTLELLDVGDEARPVAGAQLRQALGLAADEPASLRWIRDRVLEIRASKGMVLDSADPDTFSAGSFFQNVIVSAAIARALPAECPRWPVKPDAETVTVIPIDQYDGTLPTLASAPSDVKISAGWLIEHSGLRKGFRLPHSRAGLSTKHALALTNRGDATAEELAELARFIQSRVHAEFGIPLQPEPVLVGVEL